MTLKMDHVGWAKCKMLLFKCLPHEYQMQSLVVGDEGQNSTTFADPESTKI
jgi:hypothetical protein